MRVNKGTDEAPAVRCRFVAQARGDDERLDEMCAGTPSLTVVKLLLSVAAERGWTSMLLDVKWAFLYGRMKRNFYIELLRHDG